MSQTLTTPSTKITYTPRDNRTSCGFDKQKQRLQFPFFRMGCSGDSEGLVTCIDLPKPKVLDMQFFSLIASLIQQYDMFDWNWNSFRNNILTPNKEHICLNCNITDQKIWKRFEYDGYVFLNRWFDKDFTIAEDCNGKVIQIKNPNRNSVFSDLDVEY